MRPSVVNGGAIYRLLRISPRRRPWRWVRWLTAPLAAAIVVAGLFVACGPRTPSAPVTAHPLSALTYVTYAGAAERLGGMEPIEAEEQVRDWLPVALAARLGLGTVAVRDALQDSLPVRETGFADMVTLPVGPGRALYDGAGTLHVLAPSDDPHVGRTVGLLIDQHRVDAGTDPANVQIHRYRVERGARLVELATTPARPTDEVRAAYGYFTLRVDTAGGLAEFLRRATHVSWLRRQGVELVAGGWHWPDVPSAPLDSADISVLQRGYDPHGAVRSLPAFSLDPPRDPSTDDLVAALPEVDPDVVRAAVGGRWSGTGYASADELFGVVRKAVVDDEPPASVGPGLPADRTQLWGLLNLLTGNPVYSEAVYFGGLGGTEVGMTLFYTDYVAKDWVYGVGSGRPKTETGFVADPDAAIPWGHCAARNGSADSGRLWFGQNDAAFDFDPDQVSLGQQATRLFSKADGEGGTEVEPSFAFGRGLRWWDQHYQSVADHEPQYQRLDQLMRWSGAIDWLVATGAARLPQLGDDAIRSGLRFADWYAGNDTLRERLPITFVSPPGTPAEAVLTVPSKTFQQCGLSYVGGGVSLADHFGRPAVADPVVRKVSTGADGHVVVRTTGPGSAAAAFGKLRLWLGQRLDRRLTVDIEATDGTIDQRFTIQDQSVGRLTATTHGAVVDVVWHRGPLDRVRQMLERIQDQMGPRAPPTLPRPAATSVLYADAATPGLYRVGGQEWWRVTADIGPPGSTMGLLIGGPAADGSGPVHYLARPVRGPRHRAGDPTWIRVDPPGVGPAVVRPSTGPPRSALTVRVSTPDKRTTTLRYVDDRAYARRDDRILGGAGSVATAAAALLREFGRVRAAMREATLAQDGLLRGVALQGDGVVLAGTENLYLAPSEHQWSERVRQATGTDNRFPLMRIVGDEARHHDVTALRAAPGNTDGPVDLRDLGTRPAVTPYLSPTLQAWLDAEGAVLIPKGLPHPPQVRLVRVVPAPADGPPATGRLAPPDVRVHNGVEWRRFVVGDEPNGPTGHGGDGWDPQWPSAAGSGGTGGSGASPPNPWPILLVCLDDDDVDDTDCDW
jgi:hypothetical protein